MIAKNLDLTKSVVGTIIGFEEGVGRTGYRVSMLVRGQERTFDATEEAFLIRDTTEFFPYPCLGEVLFLAQFNEEGILHYFVNVNDITVPTNPVQTGLVLGTYAMFKKKIDENTPKFQRILHLEDDEVVLCDDFEELVADGTIFSMIHGGTIVPGNGYRFKLAPDADFYTWDWSTSLAPFCRCSREEAEEKRFVTRMQVGCREDIPDCYWVGFYSTRGDDSVCDLVKCFKNKAPGWE